MPGINENWKADLYPFVGKAFDYEYANYMNKLSALFSEISTNSVDYELTGSGGYGEVPEYDGENLNWGSLARGFKTVITPKEHNLTAAIGYKQAKIDKMGECNKVGSKLARSLAETAYLKILRLFSNAWNPNYVGGDGKSWAATDHPVASMGSEGRKFIADPDAGTFSNSFSDALSVGAITDAQSRATKLITPDGLPFLCEYDLVLCSADLEATCKRMFGENAKLLPGSQNNDANPVQDMQYMVLERGLDGFHGNQWAICDKRLMKELVALVYITKPMVMESKSENPLKKAFAAYMDVGAGWGDSRQIQFFNS